MMNSKRHDVGHVGEKPMNCGTSFKNTHFATVPHAVLGEETAECIGRVASVTQVAIVGFQKPDLLRRFHSPKPGFNAHSWYLG